MATEGDLTLKAVLEAVLDAKGFDEFKQRIESTSNAAGESGKKLGETGEHFDRLNKKLPTAGFQVLSRELLAHAGVQKGIGPIIGVTSAAMEGLAGTTGLFASALGPASLGLALLIPLIFSMRKSTEDAGDGVRSLTSDASSWLASLEELKQKTGELTEQNQRLYDALKASADLEKEKEISKAKKDLEALTEELKKQVVAGMDNARMVGRQAQEFLELSKYAIMAQPEVRKLTEMIRQLEGELKGETKTLAEQNKEADEAKKRAEELRKEKERQAEAERALSKSMAATTLELAKTEAGAAAARKKLFETNLADEERKFREAKVSETKIQAWKNQQIAKFEDAEKKLKDKNFIELQRKADEAFRKWKARKDEETRKLKEVADEELRIEKERIQKEIEFEEQRIAMRQLEWEGRVAVAQAGLELASSQFSKSKAILVAQAIMDTYAAATRALNQPPGPPWTIPFMVAAILQGMANVNRIRQAEAGFDDPVNDALVENFGRKFAADMVYRLSKGFNAGVGDASKGAGTVVNQSTTRIDRGVNIQNLSIRGLAGTPRQAFAELNRQLIRADRYEKQVRRR